MGRLFLVPTPIGNLEDITLRSLRILKEVDFILAEDTRKTRNLLNHFNIENHIQSHHKFNEHKSLSGIVKRLAGGESIALVTDAGTPGISDPGFLLVRECVKNNVEVETLPGAVAFIPALVNSGIPCDKFVFEGFLPQKKGRSKRLNQIADEERTLVFYESPYRLVKLLEQLTETMGYERRVCVSREISKIHEENVRGSLREVIGHFKEKEVKGEIVVILEGKNNK